MNLKNMFLGGAALALFSGVTLLAADVNLKDVRCLIAPKPAVADKSADYRDGKVYFCCNNCLGKFTAEPKKFATKANHQLVVTGQYAQKFCPLSGQPVNDAEKVKVDGAEVAFCCGNCKGAIEKAEGEKKIEMIFNDKSFEKAFAKVEKK